MPQCLLFTAKDHLTIIVLSSSHLLGMKPRSLFSAPSCLRKTAGTVCCHWRRPETVSWCRRSVRDSGRGGLARRRSPDGRRRTRGGPPSRARWKPDSHFGKLWMTWYLWIITITFKWTRNALTYEFDAVARGRGQRPGAGLLAGISVRPVGAADDSRRTVHNMITTGWETKQREKHHSALRSKQRGLYAIFKCPCKQVTIPIESTKWVNLDKSEGRPTLSDSSPGLGRL